MSTPYDVWAFAAGATNFQMVFDYDGNGNQIYIGWSRPGAITSQQRWRIMKQTFNGSSQVTNITWPSTTTSTEQCSIAFDFIWDNRTSYVYG